MPCPLKLLKEKNINNYSIWSIHFSKEGNIIGDEGYLLLGEYPHNYDNKKYNKDNLRQVNVHREGAQKIEWNLYFNQI